MASLNLSSDAHWINKIQQKKQEYGIKTQELALGTVSALVSDKQYISTCTNYKDNQGNLIAAVGTCIYQGEIGQEALKNVLSRFEEAEIINLKKELLGIYALLIKKNNKIFIFNDYYGIFDIYYSLYKGNSYVSTLLSNLMMSPIETEIDIDQIMVYLTLFTPQEGKSFYKKISKLKAREYLVKQEGCGLYKKELGKDEYRIHYNYIDEQKALSDLIAYQKENARIIGKNFSKAAIHMTGGLDSRSTLAVAKSAYSNYQKHISLFFGIGQNMMDGRIEDGEFVKKISEKFNIPIEIFDWRDKPVDFSYDTQYEEMLWNLFGEYSTIYCGNQNFHDTYLKKILPEQFDFIEFGYFLEAMRLREWAARRGQTMIQIDNYIDDYLIKNHLFNQKEETRLRELLAEIVHENILNAGIEIKNKAISINDFERLRWEISRHCDSVSLKWINHFAYNFPLFGTPDIHNLILSLPANVILDGSFQIKFLQNMDKELVNNIQIFSHRRRYRIVNNRLTPVWDFSNTGDWIARKIPFVKSAMYSLYRRYHYGNLSKTSNNVLKDIAKKNATVASIFSPKKYPQLSYLLKIRQIVNFDQFR
ncbi:hypothetical protein [Bacteroides heparinolyticus]|uniref:hypothetical protein n=1 Tax=Prevotella heparinolytica TaxID=28113 RepID=UPI00359FD571